MRTPTLISLAVAAAVLAGCASYGSSGGGMPSPGGGGMPGRWRWWNAGRHAAVECLAACPAECRAECREARRAECLACRWQHWHAGHARRFTLDAVIHARSAG